MTRRRHHRDEGREVDLQPWNWKGIDVIHAHERENPVCMTGMRYALAARAAGRVDTPPLYSMRVPLLGLSTAIATAAERPDGFFKALVEVWA